MELRKPTPTPPVYRHHKGTGQAYIRSGPQFLYLGRWGSTESHMRYQQAIAQWQAAGGILPQADKQQTTVAEVVAAFLHRSYEFNYSPDALCKVEKAMSGLMLFSDIPVKDFGPLKLRAVRHLWEKEGLTRPYVNALTIYCRKAFRHAVSMEMVDISVADALDTLENLKKGRCVAKDNPDRVPVAWPVVEATLPRLNAVVASMILVMWHSGARGGEVRIMRPCDIDTEGKTWLYRPATHKTEHHGHERVIYLGPAAQRVLRPWLARPADRYCFCPEEARAYSWLAKKPVEFIQVVPMGEKPFQRQSFIRAVTRAAKAAGLPHWTPHQIRHAASVRFTNLHGAEVAQRLLGHANPEMTAHYNKTEHERAILAAASSC